MSSNFSFLHRYGSLLQNKILRHQSRFVYSKMWRLRLASWRARPNFRTRGGTLPRSFTRVLSAGEEVEETEQALLRKTGEKGRTRRKIKQAALRARGEARDKYS